VLALAPRRGTLLARPIVDLGLRCCRLDRWPLALLPKGRGAGGTAI